MSPNIWRYLSLLLLLELLAAAIVPVSCQEVGYIFAEEGEYELDNATISQHNATDTVNFTTAGTTGAGSSSSSKRALSDLQKTFDQKVEPRNAQVINYADEIVAESPGYQTIDQVCLIYEKMKFNWSITGDPRGDDYYRNASEILNLGERHRRVGAGDCDDFAILMAAMIEAVGGTTRIILAKGPKVSHAYAEVYLGKINDENVKRIIKWLKQKYNAREITTHKDLGSGDVWLNLDWGDSLRSAAHPGYRFVNAVDHIPVYIKSDKPKQELNPSPMALFTGPEKGTSGDAVSFDATESRSVAEIMDFEWDFGDETGQHEHGPLANHTYAKGGSYNLSLKVSDIQGAESIKSAVIMINDPPMPIISLNSIDVNAGDTITFDASPSFDLDGQIVSYVWEFDNLDTSKRQRIERKYPDGGEYWVNLTVFDDKGAKGVNSLHLKVNTPPVANFTYDPKVPNAGDNVTFDASSSKDTDGSILDYIWNLGGEDRPKGINVEYRYPQGGSFPVRLTVRDNNNATANFSAEIKVNFLPVAVFNFTPKEPKIDDTVIFDATDSRDVDGRIIKYEWDFDDLNPPASTPKPKIKHTFTEEGNFNVTLTIEDKEGSINCTNAVVAVQQGIQEPVLTTPAETPVPTLPVPKPESNKAPKIAGLSPDSSSPQDSGTSITLTAEATDPDGDRILYRFFLNGQPATQWQPQNQWVWATTQGSIGENQVQVAVRDGNHAGPEEFDDSRSATFAIIAPNQRPAMTRLSADKPSPQVAGAAIVWTAVAADPEKDSILYRFFLNGQPATDWQIQSQWTWTTTDIDIGKNQVEAKIVDTKHAPPDSYDDSRISEYDISSPEKEIEVINDIVKIFEARIEPENNMIRNEGLLLAAKYPGDLTIEQICSIYEYLLNGDGSKRGWMYVSDPRGMDSLNYANYSLMRGEAMGRVGVGDSDDFAILISSLIESIGGTTRIILSSNENSTHAYAEVYLGQMENPDHQVQEIIDWLRYRYNADSISAYVETDTNEAWLSLDWGQDANGRFYPGGVAFSGGRNTIVRISNNYDKVPVKMPQ